MNYNTKKDFLVINLILKEQMPKLMKYLAIEEHEIFGLGGMLIPQFT